MMKSGSASTFLFFVCLCCTAAELVAGGPLRHLRFSCDGRYLLAQDRTEVTILTVDPLNVLFRIPAVGAGLAEFTRDSKQVVFVSSITRSDPTQITISRAAPRVEHWSLHDRALVRAAPLPQLACGTVALSGDSRTLVCVDFEGTLDVYDVDSAKKTLEIRKFSGPTFVWVGNQRYDIPSDLGSATLQFSPDDHFLIALPTGDKPMLLWDLSENRRTKAAGKLRMLKGAWNMQFTFLGPDRLLMSCGGWSKGLIVTARIVSFPVGKVCATYRIPWGPDVLRATDPSFVIVSHPYQAEYIPFAYGTFDSVRPTSGAIAVELPTGHSIVSGSTVLDVYGNRYITEVQIGEVGLYERGKGLQAVVRLNEN